MESDLFGGPPAPLPSKAQEKFPATKIHIIHNTIAMDCIEGLQADLEELLGDPDTADVVLKCQGKEIRAHKPILGARYCLVRYCQYLIISVKVCSLAQNVRVSND